LVQADASGLLRRYLFGHSSYLASYLVASGIVRVASNFVGEPTRLTLQGLPVAAPQRVAQPALAAAHRLQQAAQPVKRRKRAAGAKSSKPKRSAARGFEMSVAGA